MHISHSMMTTAKQCWRKYQFKYVMNLDPIEQRMAPKLGKIVHEAFDMYYKGFTHDEVTSFIARQFAEERTKVEAADTEDVDLASSIAQGMWMYFPKDRSIFQDISSEKSFSVGLFKNGKGIKLEGIMDGLVKKDGNWWVRELKTTSVNRRQFKEKMDVSEQATMYVWAARKLGFDVKGVVYDAIHKPQLRKGVNESMEAFGRRIIEDYKNRPDVYYQREYVYRTNIDLVNFEKDMRAFDRDLKRKQKHGGFYRNQGSCFSFNTECPYKRICFSEQPDQLTLSLFYKQREGRNSDGRQGQEGDGEQASA